MWTSAELWSLIVYPVVFVLLMKWPKTHGPIDDQSRVGLVERFAAFCVDANCALLAVAPFSFMPLILAEYVATGIWQWRFQRDFLRPTDALIFVVITMWVFVVFCYFKWHFKNQKQTLGQHLFKFKLVSMSEQTSLSGRFLIAWICWAWWPFWPWTLFPKRQDYWWDHFPGIKARKVKAALPKL